MKTWEHRKYQSIYRSEEGKLEGIVIDTGQLGGIVERSTDSLCAKLLRGAIDIYAIE